MCVSVRLALTSTLVPTQLSLGPTSLAFPESIMHLLEPTIKYLCIMWVKGVDVVGRCVCVCHTSENEAQLVGTLRV